MIQVQDQHSRLHLKNTHKKMFLIQDFYIQSRRHKDQRSTDLKRTQCSIKTEVANRSKKAQGFITDFRVTMFSCVTSYTFAKAVH